MSMKKEDYEEFQRQLELQKAQATALSDDGSGVKTKRDEDGTEYEWDEEKKAWFPKLSTDLLIKYQSGYSDGDKSQKSKSTYFDPQTKTTYEWDSKEHQWEPRKAQCYPDNYRYTDPQSGSTYSWKAKEQKWLTIENKTKEGTEADEKAGTADSEKSNEATPAKVESKTQEGEYVHPETGAVYKWNQPKQVWMTEEGDILYPSTNWESGQSQKYTDAETGKTYTWDIMDQVWKEASKEKSKKSKQRAPGTKRGASKAEWFHLEDKRNTNVYVSGLPSDITKSELSDLMLKCGIIATNPVTNEPKLKLYMDAQGNPKGDGLCCYLKRESVPLASQILDGMELRGSTIKVEEAEFEMKGGRYDASKKPKMLSKKEKKKLQKDHEKLLDWKLERAEDHTLKTDRVVIFKKMFEVQEFEEDPVLITEIRDDLRKECEKFGPVKKVIVFDRHPDGVCSVAFKQVEDALKCQEALNGRWFACKSIEAMIWDGVTDYQVEETDKEREVRLKNWEKFLSGGEEGKPGGGEEGKPEEETKTGEEMNCGDDSGGASTAAPDSKD